MFVVARGVFVVAGDVVAARFAVSGCACIEGIDVHV
jgi:hypothetical protein